MKDRGQTKTMLEEVLETLKKLEERIENLEKERGSRSSGRSTWKSPSKEKPWPFSLILRQKKSNKAITTKWSWSHPAATWTMFLLVS